MNIWFYFYSFRRPKNFQNSVQVYWSRDEDSEAKIPSIPYAIMILVNTKVGS